jgi:hypothetical protein
VENVLEQAGKQSPSTSSNWKSSAPLQCTDEEVASWLGVSTRTIESRRKQPEFAAVMNRGRAKGRISVRRAQMKLLESGNGTMGVWLGKQLLGQRDVTPIELSGPRGEPVQFSLEALDVAMARAKQRSKARSGR